MHFSRNKILAQLADQMKHLKTDLDWLFLLKMFMVNWEHKFGVMMASKNFGSCFSHQYSPMDGTE